MNQIWNDILTAFRTFTLRQWAEGTTQPIPDSVWELRGLYALLIIVFIIGGLVVSFLRLHRPFKSRLQAFFWTNAVLGGVLFFFRFQQVPFLGADIVRLTHELGIIIWIAFLIHYRLTGYFAELQQQEVEARRRKYLPRKK